MTDVNQNVPQKLLEVKAFLEGLNDQVPLQVEDRGEMGFLLVGPYPTFLFFFNCPERPDGFAISVNADAPSTSFIVMQIHDQFPDLVHYGPYCEGIEESKIVFGDEAYEAKKEHILIVAQEILAERKTQQIIAPEKKIIIPGR